MILTRISINIVSLLASIFSLYYISGLLDSDIYYEYIVEQSVLIVLSFVCSLGLSGGIWRIHSEYYKKIKNNNSLIYTLILINIISILVLILTNRILEKYYNINSINNLFILLLSWTYVGSQIIEAHSRAVGNYRLINFENITRILLTIGFLTLLWDKVKNPLVDIIIINSIPIYLIIIYKFRKLSIKDAFYYLHIFIANKKTLFLNWSGGILSMTTGKITEVMLPFMVGINDQIIFRTIILMVTASSSIPTQYLSVNFHNLDKIKKNLIFLNFIYSFFIFLVICMVDYYDIFRFNNNLKLGYNYYYFVPIIIFSINLYNYSNVIFNKEHKYMDQFRLLLSTSTLYLAALIFNAFFIEKYEFQVLIIILILTNMIYYFKCARMRI